MTFLTLCNLTVDDMWGGYTWSNPKSSLPECRTTRGVAVGSAVRLDGLVKSISIVYKTLRNDSFVEVLAGLRLAGLERRVGFWYGACYSLQIQKSYPEIFRCPWLQKLPSIWTYYFHLFFDLFSKQICKKRQNNFYQLDTPNTKRNVNYDLSSRIFSSINDSRGV